MRLLLADLAGSLLAELPYAALSFRLEFGAPGGLRATLADTGHPAVSHELVAPRSCTLWVVDDDGRLLFGSGLSQVTGNADNRQQPVLALAGVGTTEELERRFLESELVLSDVRPHQAARQAWQAVDGVSPLTTASNVLAWGATDYGAGSEFSATLSAHEGLSLAKMLGDFGQHASAGFYLRHSYEAVSTGSYRGRVDLSEAAGTDTLYNVDQYTSGVVRQWDINAADEVRHVIVKAAESSGGTPLLATATSSNPGTRATRFVSLNELPDVSLLQGRAADELGRWSLPVSTATIDLYENDARSFLDEVQTGDRVRITISTPYQTRTEQHRVQSIDVNVADSFLSVSVSTADERTSGHGAAVLAPWESAWKQPAAVEERVSRLEAFQT